MEKNKDGLIPGQLVEFDQILKIESERVKNAKRSEPKKVRGTRKPSAESSLDPEEQKEA